MTSPLWGQTGLYRVHFHTGRINIEEYNAEVRRELLPFQVRLSEPVSPNKICLQRSYDRVSLSTILLIKMDIYCVCFNKTFDIWATHKPIWTAIQMHDNLLRTVCWTSNF